MKKLITAIISATLLMGSMAGVAQAAATKYVVPDHGWVTIYKQPSTTKGTVVRLQLKQKAEYVSKYNSSWYKVRYDGKVGYITTSTNYTHLVTVDSTPVPVPVPVPVPAPTDVQVKRDKIIETAMGLIGQVNYVHWQDRQEAAAPYATDCSGFTALVFKLANIGVTLINRDDDDQAKVGTKITSYDQLQKGDLVFFGNIGSSTSLTDVGHVGIYIGDGKMIHNANPTNDVIVSNINSSYYTSKFMWARRVIN